jgi:4-hydroxy-3-methylbut-2-enyl diphosphate reductase
MIQRVVPSGYCQGVVRAVEMVRRTVARYPGQPVYVLGMIVHNRYVVDAFSRIGVTTLQQPGKTPLELLETIDRGVVVFPAHGIPDAVRRRAAEKGLTVVDAACPYVMKNRALIRRYADEGYTVLYIGKAGHPEAEAVLSLPGDIRLIRDPADIAALPPQLANVMVTNQTTMSLLDIHTLLEAIRARYPQAVILDEICGATRQRQEAVMALKDIDLLVVVGDPASNNTAQLANIGTASGIPRVLRVADASGLRDEPFDARRQRIAVTAGASTPRAVTDQVIAYLKTKDPRLISRQIPDILT